jgi:Protein of unknown function (DUF1592)/Protein of unknown function (DUF1588)/Protein of unknown function (DUF1587)/Protein of unknown function (DUF1595)/Protein of unknown function (DUF1585)
MAIAGAILVMAGPAPTPGAVAIPGPVATPGAVAIPGPAATPGAIPSAASDNEVIRRYCVRCHSDRRLRGNLSLEPFDAEHPEAMGEIAEKMVVKLRAGMMPPPGANRPEGDTLAILVAALEGRLDDAAARAPTPGSRTFQRLNRAEYTASVRDLLGIEIDAGDFLPLDTKSANFDNIADAQLLSPTLIGAYLNAAAQISRLAVGDPNATSTEAQYRVPRWASQTERVPGAPYGTRGGVSVMHTFPADGDYVFRFSFHHETTGTAVGNGSSDLNTTANSPEQVEVSIDGERVALMDVDRWMHVSNPAGVELRTPAIAVRAGPHRVTAAFLQKADGPVQDLISPHDWSLASTAIAGTYGVMSLPHMRDLVIVGPGNVTGVSDTPIRRAIFTCRPTTAGEELPCAESIIDRLGTRAFRRPLTEDDGAALLGFFRSGAEAGGFEIGIRTALEAILASPHFVFRFERVPADARPGRSWAVADADLAARLSYFLWGLPPDEELRGLAADGDLTDDATLEAQVVRMLADPKAEALGTRFAAQWLRLQDLDKVHPDVRLEPDFHQQLADDMQQETELFFNGIVREDRPMFELYTADYTWLNERLARHYRIEDVNGDHFRRVAYPDASRRGLLGHASILTLTSHAGRTSPVLRGKWVMEVLMGTPPPPPPPDVPALDETEASKGGRVLTTRERMEIHRANPTCNACHRFMDPIGLSLDNYGVTGKWRIRENGNMLDTRGDFYDGTPINSPVELQEALLARPIPLVRTFTVNLMAYALGRRVEYFDQPAIRRIVREAEAMDYRMSAFFVGVVMSDAFRMQAMPMETDNEVH